jgi:hypothetical protein
MIPFRELIISGLGWLDRNAVGDACFIGPRGARFTAVCTELAGGLRRFEIIRPVDYERRYLQASLFPLLPWGRED